MKSLLGILLLSGTAHAATVYKCTADGKITYTETPCAASASATVLNVPTAPPPDPAAAADLARQKKQADALQAARLKQEALDEREAEKADKAAAVQRKKCAKLALQKKWAEDDARAAGGSSTHTSTRSTTGAPTAADRARQHATRAAELYAVECPQ